MEDGADIRGVEAGREVHLIVVDGGEVERKKPPVGQQVAMGRQHEGGTGAVLRNMAAGSQFHSRGRCGMQ